MVKDVNKSTCTIYKVRLAFLAWPDTKPGVVNQRFVVFSFTVACNTTRTACTQLSFSQVCRDKTKYSGIYNKLYIAELS